MAKALANPRSLYRWDAKVQNYRRPDGRLVSRRAVKQALNAYVKRTEQEIMRLGREVAAGTIEVAEWQRLMANNVKNAHLSAYAAARGGWAQLTQADYGRIGSGLKFQYKRLRGFAKELANLTPDAIEDRSGMYARSASGAHEQGKYDGWREVERARGVVVLMRNRLGKGEHCKAGSGRPGCEEEAARGWVPLGEMSLPGSRRCLSRCLCEVRYRIAET